MLRVCFFALILLVLVSPAVAQVERVFLRGSVGDSSVRMTLAIDDGRITGSYFYERYRKDIRLSGTVAADGRLELSEFGAGGDVVGRFSGELKTGAAKRRWISGEWTDQRGARRFDFYLAEEVVRFTGPAWFASRNYREANKPKAFLIRVGYPQINGQRPAIGAAFNRLARTRAMAETVRFRRDMLAQTRADLKWVRERGTDNYCEVDYQIVYADDEIVSVLFTVTLETGGAHPNSYFVPLNFNLRTGRELLLGGIFQKNSKYLQVLSDFSVNDLTGKLGDFSDERWIREGAGPDARNFRNWSVTPEGILLTFDPYQVAPYAAGPQEVVVPYGRVRSMLKGDFTVMKPR